MVTPSAQQALDNLRSVDNFQWYIIPILVIVIYIYSKEIYKAQETQDWSKVFAGLVLFGMDLINEIWNGLIFHFTQYAAFWMTPGDSVFIIFIGWNIEIAFMFSIAGIAFAYTLPRDKTIKFNFGIFKLNNRWAMVIGFSAFSVFVEILLNAAGVLIWTYWFWTASFVGVWLIFLFGYAPFFVVAFWVHDMEKLSSKIKTVGLIYGIGIAAVIIFMSILHWI